MNDLAFDPPPSPPPPSYEISQHEFDRKTSRVLEQSANEPQRRVDEEGFEVWDDDIFNAALAGMDNLTLGQASSSSISSPTYAQEKASSSQFPQEKAKYQPLLTPVVPSGSGSGSGSVTGASISLSPASSTSPLQGIRPLRFTKKNQTRPVKERPAWYAEAGLGGSSPLTSTASTSSSQARVPLHRQLTVFNNTDAEREATPPPEFTPVGPSLDGPAYEHVVMTYNGELQSDTPPPAQSVAPPPPLTPQLPAIHATHHLPAHAQSMPPHHATSQAAPRSHVTHQHSVPPINPTFEVNAARTSIYQQPTGKLTSAPRLSFNPQMAYAKPVASTMATQAVEAEPQVVDPSAFYNHAVSAHYSFNVPTRMRQPTLPVQPSFQQYAQAGMAVLPTAYGHAPEKPAAPVASPRPTYGYGQAAFQEAPYNPGGAWGYSGQQEWPPDDRSHVYR